MPQNVEELIDLIKKSTKYRFKIKVVANSKVNSTEFCDEYIKIKITARAIEGKANRAIIEYLSETLGFAKSKISIVTGEKSSLKLIEISS